MAFGPNETANKLKFNLKMAGELKEKQYIELEKWRVILFKMNFIGECKSKLVSYGNLSKRESQSGNEFIISGAETGNCPNLTAAQYTKVLKCDQIKMSIDAIGPIAPSSESLTHYSIYSNCPKINAVFHVHHQELWEFLLKNGKPVLSSLATHDSKLIASESKQCIGDNLKGIFAMKAHENEIICYGSNVEEAGQTLLSSLKESRK